MPEEDKATVMATVRRYSSYCAVLIPVIFAVTLLLIAGTYSQGFDGTNCNNPVVGSCGDMLELEPKERDLSLPADRDDYTADLVSDLGTRNAPMNEPMVYDADEEEEPEDSADNNHAVPTEQRDHGDSNPPSYNSLSVQADSAGPSYNDNDAENNEQEVKKRHGSIPSSGKVNDKVDNLEYKNLDYNEEAIDEAAKTVQGAKKSLLKHIQTTNQKKAQSNDVSYTNVDYSADYDGLADVYDEQQEENVKKRDESNQARNKKRRAERQSERESSREESDYSGHQPRTRRSEDNDETEVKKKRHHRANKNRKRSATCLDNEQDYGYTCEDGPERWPEKFAECGGEKQSPINLDTSTAQINYEPKLEWIHYAAMPSRMVLQNEGHTARVTAFFDDCDRPHFTNSLTNKEYVFGELRFHWGANDLTGSEHTINFAKYPLEMHVVHYRRELGGLEQAIGVPGGLSIVALLFKISPHQHTGLASLQSRLNKVREAPDETELKPFPLIKLIPQFKKHYFTYNGSLTYPPCSETVVWIIDQKIGTISSKQVAKFRKLKKDGVLIKQNNRPTQPANKRCVIQVS